MMKFVCQITKEYGVHTMVDMNCIMIDGSGMCGGCRLTVDGQRKFTCVDGPEFDGHLVDFDEAIARSKIYEKQEARVFQRRHHCTLQELADREEAARKAAKEGK
jgi:ferredoxin--NADP+ reductase